MYGEVNSDRVTATIPYGASERPVELSWRIVRWINGPHKGYTTALYEGNGKWSGPRCVFISELKCR